MKIELLLLPVLVLAILFIAGCVAALHAADKASKNELGAE